MIITEKFVFLHYPKTGGNFVTEVLKRVQENVKGKNPAQPSFFQDLWLPNLQRTYKISSLFPHAGFEQIPLKYQHKPVFSVMRNPYDRNVSTYEFRNWVSNPFANEQTILQMFPNYPKLNFKEYLYFSDFFGKKNRGYTRSDICDIGVNTVQFIQMFFKDPQRILSSIDDEYLASDEYKNDLAEVIFLKMGNLNQELYLLLLEFGYEEEEIAFLLNAEKVNQTQGRGEWEAYYDQELIEFVRYKERLLFKIFPEYDSVSASGN